MRLAIEQFFSQFDYKPEIKNSENLPKCGKFILIGMGGSHLAGDILIALEPSLDILIHSDYGLPSVSVTELKNRLLIFSSYSGNTEEVLDGYLSAQKMGLLKAVISCDGKLLEFAKNDKTAYVEIPNTGIQPRSAVGFSFQGLTKLMGQEVVLQESQKLSSLNSSDFEKKGQELASSLKGFVPIIYASARNYQVAKIIKIILNESGKIPAFCNFFPELNHNEMTSFDAVPSTKNLSEKFYFIFLKDTEDHPKNIKRMEITKKLYEARGFGVKILDIIGKTRLEKLFTTIIIANWFAFYTAEEYGVDAEQIPMVEEFKKLISD